MIGDEKHINGGVGKNKGKSEWDQEFPMMKIFLICRSCKKQPGTWFAAQLLRMPSRRRGAHLHRFAFGTSLYIPDDAQSRSMKRALPKARQVRPPIRQDARRRIDAVIDRKTQTPGGWNLGSGTRGRCAICVRVLWNQIRPLRFGER